MNRQQSLKRLETNSELIKYPHFDKSRIHMDFEVPLVDLSYG